MHSTSTTSLIRVEHFGSASELRPAEVSLPAPNPGEVRIRNQACGVNFLDVYHRKGMYDLPLPFTPGVEAAGIVEEVGPGVGELREGDRVAYVTKEPGAYSVRTNVPASSVVRLPASIDFETAAAMLLKGYTAHYLLKKTPLRELQRGDYVLFHAAAGGVGLIMCQWARFLGLRLIGTASSDEKCRAAIEHGADAAINYTNQDFVAEVRSITEGRGVKVVYDSVGQTTFSRSLDCLSPFGMAVSFGAASGKPQPIELAQLASKGSLYVTRPTAFSHLADQRSAQTMADDLFAVVKSGAVKIRIAQRIDLRDAAQAHELLESGATTGSLVLLP